MVLIGHSARSICHTKLILSQIDCSPRLRNPETGALRLADGGLAAAELIADFGVESLDGGKAMPTHPVE